MQKSSHFVEPFQPRLSKREVWGWCLVMAGIAYWVKLPGQVAGSHTLNFDAMIGSVFTAGAFTFAAWVMILARAGRLVANAAAPAAMVGAALVFGLLCAIPAGPAIGLALLVLGATLLRQPQLTRSGRQAGWLLLALALCWVSPELRPLHILVGRMDAQAAALMLRFAGLPATVQGNVVTSGGASIEILSGCASSWPLAQIVLAFLVVTIYRSGNLAWRQAPWLAASLLASIMLTELRLALCAVSHASYLWWHDGPGVTIYELAGLAGALIFPLLAGSGADEIHAAPEHAPA